MTRLDVTTPPKRLHILDDEEIEALYGRPCLTGDERIDVFTLTQPETDLLASFTHLPVQLYFLLQLGYFKAKQMFFTFVFDDVIEDITYLLERYFPARKPSTFSRRPFKKTAHFVRSIREIFPPTAFPSERNATSTRRMKPIRNTSSPTAMNFWSIVWCAIASKLAISFAATVSTFVVSRMI